MGVIFVLPRMSDMKSLQAEDDGFLMQLKMLVLEKHQQSLEIDGCSTIDECVSKILDDSAAKTGIGAALPFYLPWRDDDGYMRGSNTILAWAGSRIDVPLYGNIDPEGVQSLITGNRVGATQLFEGFMSYSPAFRVALLVHHICQIVLMHPMAAEAFVLGRYHELPFDDAHFKEYGVPSTDLISIEANTGLCTEWRALSPKSFKGSFRAEGRISGWNIRIRGSQPKEALMIDAWKEIRDRLDAPLVLPYTSNGKPMAHMEPAPAGRSRRRVSDPDVDRMIAWASQKLEEGTFPMRGGMKDWKSAVIMLGNDFPDLVSRWTGDSMRKAYERRRRNGR